MGRCGGGGVGFRDLSGLRGLGGFRCLRHCLGLRHGGRLGCPGGDRLGDGLGGRGVGDLGGLGLVRSGGGRDGGG
ncbi:hypothetical protein CF54_36895, partial [Streptomyces sp. Tu 6176]